MRASDVVFDTLLADIMRLELLPGTLLSETELSQRFSVSRTPVRAAIAQLVGVGLVQVAPQVGTRVALIDLAEVEQARFVRESLEVAVFRVASALPDRDVSPLRDQLAEQETHAAALDAEAFFAADVELHHAIFTMAGYPGAWTAAQRMRLQLDRLRRLSFLDEALLHELVDEHTQIVDALERGDAAAGTACLRSHIGRVSAAMANLPPQHVKYLTSASTRTPDEG